MKMTWANRITILRILLIVPFVSFMLQINDAGFSQSSRDYFRYGAIAVFVVMGLSDAVDGYLARVKRQITNLGKFLDPLADKLLITSACLLLTSNRAHVADFTLPSTVVVCIVGKDVFLTLGFVIVYLTTSQARISPAFIGKLATALQLSMVTGILIAPEVSAVFEGWIWVLRVLWWSAAATAVLATLIYIRQGSGYIERYEHETAGESD